MSASEATAVDGLLTASPDSAHARVASPPNGRINLAHEPPLRLGPLGVEPALRRVLHDDGREEILEPRVMQVLVALIRADGQIVSRDDLMTSCWHGVVVGEDAINRVMGRVRRLADGIGGGEIKLETVTKVGYRLVALRGATGTAPARSPISAPADERVSICVLPFANMSDDPQQEYFSDGICEDIITDLAKVSALSVVARTTSFTFKGRAVDVPQLARQLNVSHVLEGSVRKAGGRVRITAQLINGATGDHVWGERWDRDLTDIFALQDEISQAIVGALRLKLLPAEKAAIERRGTDNADAYNLYLLARSYTLTGNQGDPRQYETIERLCRRAAEIDPGYAQAWALMAWAQKNLHISFGRAGDGGQAALDRALAINPELAEARSLKARRLFNAGRHDEAAAEIAVALQLDPESYEVNNCAAGICYDRGRLEDAARHYEKVAALIETDLGSPHMLVSCYTALGDPENTQRIARMGLARAEKVIAQDRSNGFAMAVGVTALAALGERERAKDWMGRALLVDPENLLMRYNFACALTSLLNDRDAALEMLGPVLERNPGDLLEAAKADADFDKLRDDPRFQDMIAAAEARLTAANRGNAEASESA